MADYQFKYSPLTGRITGKQMLEQTEQAINALASQVDSAAGQVEIISTLANEANENAANALEVAEEALATTGRTYITVSGQADANTYYDSQLIYIADSTSTNIPVADTGMLEVKTNDNKTACEQVFISDSSGDAYYRNGEITAETVGDVTTYTVTWGGWSSQPASQAYVQGELANYLPLSGGTVAGGLTVEGGITGNLSGNATNDGNGNNIVNTYLPAVVGAVVAFAGSTSPAGWLLCDGSAVSRTTYAALFAVIGTTYGSGDGSSTFNVPNLTDRFIQGNATAGTVKSAGLPNITGHLKPTDNSGDWTPDQEYTDYGGAVKSLSKNMKISQKLSDTLYNGWGGFEFDASKSNAIYGNSTTVQPPAVTMRYIIKY